MVPDCAYSLATMPDDVDDVTTELLDRFFNHDPTPRRPGSATRMAAGVTALDLGDDDHVFQVSVKKLPRRRWRPERPVHIGVVDGVAAELVGVDVDNFVHVLVTAAPSEERERLTRAHTDATGQWAAATKDDRGDFPTEPAERLLRVTVRLHDSQGTAYLLDRAHCGGTGTEWDAGWRFHPRPPQMVSELELVLETPGGQGATVSVPLA